MWPGRSLAAAAFPLSLPRSLLASCKSMRPLLADLTFVVWRHGTFCASHLWVLASPLVGPFRVMPLVLSVFVDLRLGNLGS